MKNRASIYLFILCIYLKVFTMELYSQAPDERAEWLEWKHQTSGLVYATPVISDGTLYIGSTDSVFYAIEAGTGKEKWRYHSGNSIQSSAAIHKNLIFFESGNRLLALNGGGKLKWERDLCEGEVTNQLDPWDFHHSSPYVHDGNIYIGTERGSLLGFDALSGKQVLRCQTISEQPIRTTPAVSGGLVIYGDWDGVLYANDISTGALAWKYDTKQEGTYPWPNSILTQLVVQDGSIYFAGRSNRLYSLDVQTGKKNWHYSSPTDQWLIGGPAVHKGVVYLGSSDQRLFHAIDASSGTLIWSTELDCRIWGSAAIKEGNIYIGSNSLYVLDKVTGEVMRQFEFPQVHEAIKYGEYTDRTANFHSSPILFDGMIILGSDDGNVYSIREL
jgi:outer membrane protein assembly factor BamB